jgi:hypothetical protein
MIISSTSNKTDLTAPHLWKVMQISHPWLAGETEDSKDDESGLRTPCFPLVRGTCLNPLNPPYQGDKSIFLP